MINPARVEMVRRRLGLTKLKLADALKIDRKALQRLERGEGDLSGEVLARLHRLSGYPREFFRSGDPEYPNSDGVSFRSQRSLTAAKRDSALAAAAIAFELDDWVCARFELPHHALPQLGNRSPEEAAAAVRAHWGIGVRPIGNMINLLEAHSVRVFSLIHETRHLDAYSFWRNEKPYVFLNMIKSPEHSRFDAAHELGHLVMHQHTGSGHKSAEDEANAFASAFLMPRADLLAHAPAIRSLGQLIEVKSRWRVSAAAMNYALHKAGLVSDWHYRGYYIELGKFGRDKEPNGIEPETSQFWAKVLMTLWQEGISLVHIADELHVPPQELSELLFGIVAPVSTERPKVFEKPRLVQNDQQ
jgi:Zn-dependent peptidase ImmA (M78 family)